MASKIDWSKKSDRRLYDAVEELCRPVLGIFVDADDVGREVALVGLVFEAKEIRQATDGRGGHCRSVFVRVLLDIRKNSVGDSSPVGYVVENSTP